MKTTKNYDDDDWGRCEKREIQRVAQRLRTRRLLAAVRRDTIVVTTLMVSLFSGYFYFGVLPETRIDLGGITCLHLQPLAERIVADQLPPETRKKVRQHLRYCEFCRKKIDEIRLEADRGPETDLDEDRKFQVRSRRMIAAYRPEEWLKLSASN